MLSPLPAQAQQLCTCATKLHAAKGSAHLREGEHWQNFWWVGQGAFRLYYLALDGQASNKIYLGGAMFWPMTPDLATQPVTFWVEAMEGSEVLPPGKTGGRFEPVEVQGVTKVVPPPASRRRRGT